MVEFSSFHLFVLFTLVARLKAEDFQSILTQISAGNNDCSKNELYGDFDFKTIPQLSALCNIPLPDIQQSDFLIENNVVPILCMGLMDVSLRLCQSAKDGISPFEDIFPPNSVKYNKIFVGMSNSKDFSLLNEFCSSTVTKYAIHEAASNITDHWWKVINKQLSDKSQCSNMCRSKEENKVHPLCAYILWFNAVYINNRKNIVGSQQISTMDEDKQFDSKKDEKLANQERKTDQVIGFVKSIPATQEGKTDQAIGFGNSESANEEGKIDQVISYVKSEVSARPSKPIVGSVNVSVTDDKPKTSTETKPYLTNSRGNNVNLGTVKQLKLNNEDPAADTKMEKENRGISADMEKPVKKEEKVQRKYIMKDSVTTPNSTGNVSAGSGGNKEVKLAYPSDIQKNSKDGLKINDSASSMSPSVSSPQGPAPSVASPGKPAEGMVESDFSLEVTPEVGADQPIAAEIPFQPPYSDEEGENGDGDDVEVDETNPQDSINSNGSKPSFVSSVVGVQQSPLEGDKVYGEGEIVIEDHFIEAEESHFFTYFLCMAVLTIMAYLAFHNKKKLIALAVEGRRSKGGRRRPNSSHYSKLDCSLEEALVSNTTASVTHVLY